MFGTTFQPGGGGGGDLVLIKREVLSVAANAFPSITVPGDYYDLLITSRLRSNLAGTGSGGAVQFNGDAGNNYNWDVAYFNSAGAGYAGAINVNNPVMFTCTAAGATANFWGTGSSLVADYLNNSAFKNYVSPTVQPTLNAVGGLYIYYWGGIWKNVNPITSFVIFESNAAQFLAGSTVCAYGVGKR